MILYDGFESAQIGVGTRAGQEVMVYDYHRCVQVLIARDGMDYEEATEFMEFNVLCLYVGDQTPIFIRGNDESED